MTIVCDFEKATVEEYKEVADKIDSSKREIGILINNAGVMYRSPNKLLDQSKKDDWAQVSVNCAATVLITRACLSGMVKRKKGLIVNISSTAAYRPLPLMGVYSASKVCVSRLFLIVPFGCISRLCLSIAPLESRVSIVPFECTSRFCLSIARSLHPL